MIAEPQAPGTNVVQALIDEIRSAGLRPGDRLPSIRTLASRLRIRPHLVRDALLQAQTLGVIRIHPRSGAFLQPLPDGSAREGLSDSLQQGLGETEHHVFHLLEARRLIEVELVQQAARRRRLEDLLPVREALSAMHVICEPDRRPDFAEQDVRFHLAIARLAGNPVLLAMLQSLLTALRPFLNRLPFETDCRQRTEQSHTGIYRALVEGSPEAARDAMREHLQLAYDNLLGEVQSIPA